jgi:hypothetical protein
VVVVVVVVVTIFVEYGIGLLQYSSMLCLRRLASVQRVLRRPGSRRLECV